MKKVQHNPDGRLKQTAGNIVPILQKTSQDLHFVLTNTNSDIDNMRIVMSCIKDNIDNSIIPAVKKFRARFHGLNAANNKKKQDKRNRVK